MAVKKKSSSRTPARLFSKIPEYWWRYNYVGVIFGLIAFSMSLSPSLLPRPWLYQGIIGGLSLAIGYGIGTAVSSLGRWLTEYEPPAKYKPTAWKILFVFAAINLIGALYLGDKAQSEVRRLIQEPPADTWHVVRILILTVIVFWLFVGIARGLRGLTRYLIRQLDKILPRRVSVALGFSTLVLVVFWVISGVFYNFFVNTTNNIYRVQNDTTSPGIVQPKQPERSGSKASLIPWETIGRQGQNFVAGGPTQVQLTKFSRDIPKQPVRIYSGLKSADTPAARAQLAVEDLERAGGFQRKVLILATPTGTGWLEPQSMDSIEYMYNGDTAIVASQYSYLPSWISFLVDKNNAENSGQALFDAVYGKWATLPKETRPKLIAYGLSLGSFGGQSAYSGVNDLRLSIDGALFQGTPNDTKLWQQVTADRDPGTPEWQPTYQNGQAVRFAATNDDITKNQQNWQFPRILYMQHASDPVVWFNFNLTLDEPDWLKEKRGPDVSQSTSWNPFITVQQIAIDQFFGTSVPNGHGHNYPNTIVNAWNAVIPPPGWDQDKTARLQNIINAYSDE